MIQKKEDERSVFILNRAYAYAFRAMFFLSATIIVYRGFTKQAVNTDLLLVFIVGAMTFFSLYIYYLKLKY